MITTTNELARLHPPSPTYFVVALRGFKAAATLEPFRLRIVFST